MPRLSKIRLTGCRYDGLRKMHENSIFDLSKGERPDHSLFTLENNGGKGVMLQLIFQLLLPETRWGKNNGNQVISMFYDKKKNLHSFTFHVVLEWVLDSLPEKRLITGIGVKSIIKNTSTDDEEKVGLSYFLYTHEHDNRGYFTVENLPLYDEETREARDLKDLEEFLNENKRDFIKYSQSSGRRKDSDYYNYLESRGIYRDEWLILKKINKSEGGISDYFSKASNNKSIFDKVIIPAISENIRNYSSNDENSLIDMFKSNLSITKDLPILLKRENDYRQLYLSIDPLIENADSGVRFIEQRERLIARGNDIFYILNDELGVVKDRIEKWTDSKKRAEEEGWGLRFDRDNLIYNEERNDYLDMKSRVKTSSDLYESQGRKLEEAEKELLHYRINKELYHKKEVEKKIRKEEMERENLIKVLELDDIQGRLEELDYELELEWKKTRGRWEESQIDYFGYKNYSKRQIDEERSKRRKYEDRRLDLENKINKFELEKEEVRRKKQELEKYYDSMSLEFPERILKDLTSRQETDERKILELEEEKSKLDKDIDDRNQKLVKERFNLDRRERDLEILREGIKGQEKEELALAREVGKLLLEDYKGSYLDRDWFLRAGDNLASFYNSKRESLEGVQRKLWEKNIDRSLNIGEYFIPNKDIIGLKEEIEELGVYVETGTEYMMNLGEEDRGEIIDNNIGFIYSLVISNERDWQVINKNIKRDIILNNMVPIYIRSQMKDCGEDKFKYIVNKADSLINYERYHEWRGSLQDDFKRLREAESKIRADIEKIQEVSEDLKLLSRGKLVFELKKEENQLQVLIEESSGLVLAYQEELSSLKNKLNLNVNKKEEVEKNLSDIKERIILLGDYITSSEEIDKKSLVIKQVDNEVGEIKDFILDIDIRIDEIGDIESALSNSYNKWKMEVDSLTKRVNLVYKGERPSINIDEAYESFKRPDFSLLENDLILVLEEREIIDKDLRERDGKLSLINNNIKHYNDQLEGWQNNLRKLGENWQDYEDLNLPLIEIEIIINELNKRIKAIEEDRKNTKSSIDNLEGRILTSERYLGNMAKDILKKYKKMPTILDIEDSRLNPYDIERKLKSNKEFIKLSREELDKDRAVESKLKINLNRIGYNPELDPIKGKMDKILKEKILNDLDLLVDSWLQDMRQNKIYIDKTSLEAENFRNKFLKNVELKLAEEKLKSKLVSTLKDIDLNNFRGNRESFSWMKTHFNQEIISLSRDKEKAEQAMKQWTSRASIYVIKMIETLKEMVSSMNYVNENQHVFPLVRLKGREGLPREEKEVEYLLEEHFIQSIDKILSEGSNLENLDNKKLNDLMGDSAIFSKAVQGKYPVLFTYKMTENNEFRYDKPRDEYYDSWEAINKGEGISTEGSGGQTLSVTTFVTMMIMSFKKKYIGNENPSTILLLDNPFGVASGRHVLDPIFEIADKLNFQLICFAAPGIIKVEISERFPVFWELRIEDGKIVQGGRLRKQ